MTVGIIADLHDHTVNFAKFLTKTAQFDLDELWIAGDLGTSETMQAVEKQFSKHIRVVAGNVETGHTLVDYQMVANHSPHLTWSAQEPLSFFLDNRLIALFHFPRAAQAYAKRHQPTVVIAGHSHRPDLKKIGETWYINPGTLAGIFTPATYVLADLTRLTFTLNRLYE